MSQSTLINFLIKRTKMNKQLIKQVINFLLERNFDYNVSFLGKCIGSKKLFWEYEEKKLSKDSYEKIDSAIEHLIKHNGGSIMLGWKNNRKKYELFFSIRPSIKEGVYIALVFNDSIRYDKNGDYKLNNNYDLLFEVMNDLSKFINEEMNLKTTKIEISKI